MGPSVARKEKGSRTLPSTSDRYFVDIPAFPELLRMTRLSCRVATRALSLRFCRENFNSGDFFLAIFHLSRRKFEGGYKCNFHLALVTRQNLKTLHHLREQKIACVAAA